MEGAANIYNVLILIVIIFFRPVDKAVENKVDKMWGQEGEVCPARQRWHWFAMGEMELNTIKTIVYVVYEPVLATRCGNGCSQPGRVVQPVHNLVQNCLVGRYGALPGPGAQLGNFFSHYP